MHPLDEFEKWFDAQPKEVRSDCAFYAEFFELFERDYEVEIEESFRAWFKDRSISEMATLARILTVREIFDLIIFFRRGTPEAREKAEEFLRHALERFQESGNTKLAEDAQAMIEKLPEQSEMWIKAKSDWKELLDGAFSSESLDGWFWGEIDKSTARFVNRQRRQ